MSAMWSSILESLGQVLTGLAAAVEPWAGSLSWGLAIMALTLLIRVVLLPLGVVQARTIRARRRLAPQASRITARFDTSAELRRRNPDRFMRNVQRQRAALRDLHREHGVRPVASFAVVLAQSPVLFALYRMLGSPEIVPALVGAPFVLIESLSLSVVAGAGLGGVVLLVILAVTTWYGHAQMSRGTPTAPGQPRPAVLGLATAGVMTAVAATLPAGVLLYWATTGLVTVAQQAILLR